MICRQLREGNGTPLQYSCLENPMDGGAWWAAVCGVAKSRAWLSNFTFTFHFNALGKEMATQSSVLAWRIPGMVEPWWAAVYGVSQSRTQLKRLSSSSSSSSIWISEVIDISPAILIPACASSRPVFLMIYPAYKLNKQGDNIQPWCTPFSIWNQSVVPCPVLTVASWPAYRFLKRQVRWSGIPISFRIFHSFLWST